MVATASSAPEIVALVEAASLRVDVGLDLLDGDNAIIEDISADLVKGSAMVARDATATIHGTCRFAITRDIQWGSQRLRPRITLTSDDWTCSWNLGVFLPTTPKRAAGRVPETFDVTGYDRLVVLATCHGASYSAPAGASPITLVKALIAAAGETGVVIDDELASTVLAAPMVWPLDQRTTTLTIINDLLATIGYQPLWCDRDGVFRSAKERRAATTAPEWVFSADSPTTSVGQSRAIEADYFATPNRWVFVRDDPAQAAPTEGAGLYTVVNQSDGPTSVDARGRVISTVVRLAATDQTALVAQGDRAVEAAKKRPRQMNITVSPCPSLWHSSVVAVSDAILGVAGSNWVVTAWKMPLDGQDMTLQMTEVQL